ncbi:hypothetical protein OEZ86_010692 [Tetradesmus obliquus]|nr:hypothetical protein OEZ86_010692 [Tetradesmus obliquus]
MSFTLSSPFASISGEALEEVENANPDVLGQEEEIILDDYAGADDSAFEVEDLDPLSALEKYCRSDLPAQRLTYAAGIGAAVVELESSAVSGSLVCLLRELLGDVYADVRLTALQQVLAVARRLRAPGMTFQGDLESLWDMVQPLLLDADVENQEAAASVLAELTHLVAWGNAVAASQKLVWAVQRLARLPQELATEGALAALRLITEVVVPRPGSPLCFAAIEHFAVATFKDMAAYERSADVRQAVALLLPRFVRHMPPSVRAMVLPGLLKTLASDTHWNVRAEVPDMLINLLAVTQHNQQSNLHNSVNPQGQGQSNGQSNNPGQFGTGLSGSFDPFSETPQQQPGETSHTAAAVGEAAAAAAGAAVGGFTLEERKAICEAADKLCRDASHLVKVPALASLGQLLPLLPAADAAAAKPPLLALLASTAKPPATIAGVRLPLACAFHLGKVARHVGGSHWPVLQPAYISLAAAAVAGDADVAAALLLGFPDLAAALGPGPTRAVLVPVMLELLHGQLELLAPVLSVMLYDITAALPGDLRICLLQLLPSLAIQPDREVAGDWRARMAVAQHLPAVARVLTPPQVAYCVWPLLLTLAKDPVAAVRAAAAAQDGLQQGVDMVKESGGLQRALSEFQQLAKADVAVALAADVLHHFVAMLRTEQMPLQAAAAAALAGLCTYCSGRDAARLSGALQQLVHVVQEQQKDPGCSAAEHAAKALMNAAACDAAKATIHRAGGVPSLMQLLRCGSDLGVLPFAGKPCPAAVYAVGALLNMVLVKQIQATLVKLDGMALLEDVAAQHGGNVLGARARSAVSLLQLQLTASHFQAPEATVILIKGGEVVNHDLQMKADVLIKDGLTAEVAPNIKAPAGAKVIDASGSYVMPGGIDPHTHLAMPFMGQVACDDFYSGQAAALAGGTTMHIDFALPVNHNLLAGFKEWQAKAQLACADFGFHMAVTKWNSQVAEDMGKLVQQGINSFKFFMAYKGALMVNDEELLQGFVRCRQLGALPQVHAENGEAVALGQQLVFEAGITGPEGHALSRPAVLEGEATGRAIRLASFVGVPLYVVHVMSIDAMEEVARARKAGLPIVGEPVASGLALDESAMWDANFTKAAAAVMSPPIRSKQHGVALKKALAGGLLQLVATDHAVFNSSQKAVGRGDFRVIPNGVNGLEERMHVVWQEMVVSGLITPRDFVRITSTAAAQIFNVYPRKGRIAPGSDADVIVLDPRVKHTISAATHHSRIDTNVYEGKQIQGKVTVTISRGRLVWFDSKLNVEPGSGRFIPLPTHGPLFDGIDKAGADTAARLVKAFAAENGATPVVREDAGGSGKASKDEL